MITQDTKCRISNTPKPSSASHSAVFTFVKKSTFSFLHSLYTLYG